MSTRFAGPRLAAAAAALLLALCAVLFVRRWRTAAMTSSAVTVTDAGVRSEVPRMAAAAMGALLVAAESSPTEAGVVGPLEGRVVSARDGAGVADAEILFEGPTGVATTRSDPGGAFRFAPVGEGSYVLGWVHAAGFEDRGREPSITFRARIGRGIRGVVLELEPRRPGAEDRSSASRLEPELDDGLALRDAAALERGRAPSGAIVGRVVLRGTSAAPASGFAVLIIRARGDFEEELASASTVLDAEGHYAVRDLPPGPYAITVAARGMRMPPRVRVNVEAGLEARADFEIEDGCRIIGTVIDATNAAPIVGARVSLEGGGGLGRGWLHDGVSSDARGEFSLSGLVDGRMSVSFSANGFHTRIVGVAGCESGHPLSIALNSVAAGERQHVELVGVGIIARAAGDAFMVGGTIAGGGAEAAGIRTGDRVLAVDGEDVSDLGLQGAVERIRGPEGTTVKLLVLAADAAAAVELSVERRPLRTP